MIQIQTNNFFKINNREVDLDFNLHASMINVLQGNNGIGKSTLVEHLKLKYLAENFAFVDQFPLCPVTHYQVRDIFKILNEEFKNSLTSEVIEQKYNLVINDLLDKDVRFLSGGEQQAVKLALGLALNKESIFLDEPFQYLDINKVHNLQLILEMLLKEKKYVCIIEHDQEKLKNFKLNKITMANIDNRIKVQSGI